MTANTQVATRPVDQLKQVLATPSVQEQFQNALKDNSSLFVSSLIELYSGDSYLQNCQPKLVVMEALKAATLKLPLNKNLGFAWIVPYAKSYKDDSGKWQKNLMPQFQLGWRGIVQLALRTGQYRNINCGPVFEGELKRIDKLSGAVDLSGVATSELEVGYFAFFELINGYSKTEYWAREKAEQHAIKYNQECKKANALAGNWKDHFSKRASSTVLKHLLKNYGIMSVEMEQAFTRDEESSGFDMEYAEKANSTMLHGAEEPIDAEFSEESIDPETGEVIGGAGAGSIGATTGSDQPPFPVG